MSTIALARFRLRVAIALGPSMKRLFPVKSIARITMSPSGLRCGTVGIRCGFPQFHTPWCLVPTAPPLRSCAPASSVSLLFALPSERRPSLRIMGFGWDGAPSWARLSRAAIGPTALPSRLSALPLYALLVSVTRRSRHPAAAQTLSGPATSHTGCGSGGAPARRSQSVARGARPTSGPTCARPRPWRSARAR